MGSEYTGSSDKLAEILASGQTQKELDIETLTALAGKFVVDGVEVPPPVVATLTLFEMIESPFLVGESDELPSMAVFEAIYILAFPEKAADLLINSIDSNFNAFRMAAFTYGKELGQFNIKHVIIKIQMHLQHCMMGFKFIPKGNDSFQVKKKDTMTWSGLRVLLQVLRRFATLLIIKSYLKLP